MSDPILRHDGSGCYDMYICVVCNTGNMHKHTIRSHLNGHGHKSNFLLKSEIESLGLLRWRQHMKAELYDHFFTTQQVVGIPTSIRQQLEKYTMLEKISLLELAVWKASCLWFDGSMSVHTMQDILDQWAIYESFDPAAYKHERRFTGSVAIIMRGVIKFLE